jgi:hypothetical protein
VTATVAAPLRFSRRLNADLVILVSPQCGSQLWAYRRLRKPVRCCACQGYVARLGPGVFAPVGNLDNRADRLCLTCLDRLEHSR